MRSFVGGHVVKDDTYAYSQLRKAVLVEKQRIAFVLSDVVIGFGAGGGTYLMALYEGSIVYVSHWRVKTWTQL